MTLEELARQMAELQTVLEQVRTQLARIDHDDEWLTPEEFEALTHISKRWLYDNADALPFVRRVNRKLLRVSRKGLIRWMETRRGS
jgi:hypothetical protein